VTWSTGWPAPAKINRFLHIVGRRADGYHLLETVFQFLDFADELAFRPRRDGLIRRLDAAAVPDDLAVRAARCLAETAGGAMGADIYIDKRLPAGGGLGGGSSDAATTLVALNHLWDLGATTEELQALGLRLGADVPVFMGGETAWAEGVGEQLHPLAADEPWVVLVDPGVTVATSECFAAPELTRQVPRSKMRRLDAARQGNVFEPVVRERYPSVGAALDWLGQYAEARLTGSGGCCFGVVADRAEAQRVAALVPHQWRGLAVRAVNQSPLLSRLGRSAAVDSASRANGA
jgi:4-diphosphocytidyl-2-C-methyl-D-erythritol kinase